MNQCRQCGATLPENSNTCLQCGTVNTPAKRNSGDVPQQELDFLKPALLGGAALGGFSSLVSLLSALSPRLGLINIVCCLWLLGGGALAAFLLNKQRPGGLKYGDGAIVGAFAGVFGAIVATIFSIPLRLMQTAQLAQAAEQIRQSPMPPAAKDFILQMLAPGIHIPLLLFGLIFAGILYAVFGTAGGALSVAILNRQKTD